jgi:chromate transporter
VLLALPSAVGQVAVILVGALLGGLLMRWVPEPDIAAEPPPIAAKGPPIGPRAGLVALTLFVALLVALPIAARVTGSRPLAVTASFYEAGSLVFGGGHVVLPLLEERVVEPGWISGDRFLAGYGAAQAVPGPLFTFAAYLGAALDEPPNGLPGGLLALAAIFLPSFLLVFGVLPWWARLRTVPHMTSALAGANAAVVGLLASALATPLATSAIHGPADLALAAAAFVLLVVARVPPWLVVIGGALAGIGLEATGVA